MYRFSYDDIYDMRSDCSRFSEVDKISIELPCCAGDCKLLCFSTSSRNGEQRAVTDSHITGRTSTSSVAAYALQPSLFVHVEHSPSTRSLLSLWRQGSDRSPSRVLPPPITIDVSELKRYTLSVPWLAWPPILFAHAVPGRDVV